MAYRWVHTDDWTGRQLGIVVHADLVRIHPFTDGNGRTTRLLADLVYATVQNP
ncbi:Fic family protein, partial [Escherichia coli]|nr:Fic family protein [Escherichia coli]